MDMPDDKLKAAIEAALAKHAVKVTEIVTKAQDDVAQFKAIQDSTKAELAKLNADGGKLYADLNAEKLKQDTRILDLEQKMATGLSGLRGSALTKSVGQQFIESDELKNFAPIGKSRGSFQSKPFALKNITSVAASGGAGIAPEYLPTPIIPNFQNLTIRSLLSVGTTESDLIYWFKELVFTNQAAVVAEGNLKPQSDITYARANVPVVTLAHWMKASKQVLSDFKLLMTLIDTRLTFGLRLSEEREILFGDGTGDHLLGLIPQASAYAPAHVGAFDTRIDVIAHAILQTRLAFYPATGIVLSPADWSGLMLTKDSQHRYLFASPIGATPAMLWGLPVVEADSMNVGEFLVGSFKLAATLFDREQAQILVSTEDQDDFVRNMVTILCEERIALAVTRPQAFVHGTFPVGTS